MSASMSQDAGRAAAVGATGASSAAAAAGVALADAPVYRTSDPAVFDDPFALYARLRDQDPCHWSESLRGWVITRYEDVRPLLADRSLSSDRMTPFFDAMRGDERARLRHLEELLARWMVFRDPPDHTRLRRAVSRSFHASWMLAQQPMIEALIDELLAELPADGEFDFIGRFAGPLPALVIMSMLGLPRDDYEKIKRWSDDMALFIGSGRGEGDRYPIADRATEAMAEYFLGHLAERRARPRADLMSALITTTDEAGELSDTELVSSCILLLFAGHETTTNLLGNGMLWLPSFPGELARWRERRDDRAFTDAAVEEVLRFDGPQTSQVRIVTEPRELHGRELAPGDRLFLFLTAANRDPRAFEDVDLIRLDRKPNLHVTFGHGQHVCLGAPLARLEGQLAFPRILGKWRHIAVPEQPLAWDRSLIMRGVKSLRLAVGS